MADENQNAQVPNHSGWHAFWGIIGAGFGLAALAAVTGVAYYGYNYYVPASVHTQVQAQVDQLHTQLTDIRAHVPQVRTNGGPTVSYGVGPDDQPNRTVATTAGIYDELADAIKKTNDNIKLANAETNRNIAATNESVKALSGQVSALGTKIDGIDVRVSKLETVQATPAPAPQPAPQTPAAPQVPQSAAPAPAETSQAAPQAPAPEQVSQTGGGVNLVVPKWMKVQIDGEQGDHARACTAPRHLEIDFKSPKCYKTGRFNQYGKPIINCPNRCL